MPNTITGVQEWTNEEHTEKEAALKSASRAVVSVVKGKLDNELIISSATYEGQTREISYQIAAVNSLLAWLNFPTKLRPFLDCLLAIYEDGHFTATNLEIGKQIRIGRRAKDDSTSKYISRTKRKFLDWQNSQGFDIVEIQLGKFDPKRRRNEPSKYKVNIMEWLPKIIGIAKSNYRWNLSKNHKLKEIRRAARIFLNQMPDAPPLRGFEPKTLSEEEKLDRRVHQQINAHLKNLEFVNEMGWSDEQLHQYLLRELDKAFIKKRGLVGHLVTPTEEEPEINAPVAHRLKQGILLDDFSADLEEINNVQNPPKYYKNGEWFAASKTNLDDQNIGGTIHPKSSEKNEKIASNLLKTQAHDGTFFDGLTDSNNGVETVQTSSDRRSDKFEVKSSEKNAETSPKPLIPKTHDGTFSGKKPQSVCRSCDAPVLWRTNINTTKKMPLNLEPDPEGNIGLLSDGIHFRILKQGGIHTVKSAGGDLYKSHFDTCPKANKWRSSKRN